MDRRPKILIISFSSLLLKFFQTLPLEIVKQTGWKTKILVPPFRKENWTGKKKYLEKAKADLYKIAVCPVILNGNLVFSLFRPPFKRILQDYQPDIIDLENEPFSLSAYQLVRLRNRCSPHSKIILHSWCGNDSSGLYKTMRLIKNYNLQNIQGIIFKHPHTPPTDIATKLSTKFIPMGVNPDVFRPRDLPELNRKINPDGHPVIGFVGNFRKESKLPLMLKVLEDSRYKFLFINGNYQKSGLEKLVKKHKIDATIIFNASHEEIAQYLNCMNILIAPLSLEKQPFSQTNQIILEALASGVAVMIPKDINIPDIITDSVFTYQHQNLTELREKIQYLLENPLIIRTLGWKSRKIVQNHFSWQKIAKQTIKFYREIMAIPT